MTVNSMFKAAQLVGRAIREVHRVDGITGEQAQSGAFDVTILLGGQIKGRRLRLFMIYSAGNFIEATADTPYLQVGEHKYGKPILDRAVTDKTDLYDALKIGLISMDSTIRSNSERRLADRSSRRAPRRGRGRPGLPHRWERALFSRPPRAVVVGTSRRPPVDPAAPLQARLGSLIAIYAGRNETKGY